MSAITFAFDQQQMNALIKSAKKGQNILVSIVSAKAPKAKKSNLFLAAQLSDAVSNAPVTTLLPPAVGCPNPPGWKVGAIPTISHAQLEGAPKFIIPASGKNKLNVQAANGQLFADLDGFLDGKNLQTRLSFKQAKNSRQPVAIADKLL